MDSPHHQPSSVPLQRQRSAIVSPTPARIPLQRSRTISLLPSSVDQRGAVRKRTPPADGRNRSISLSQAERLHNVALNQFEHQPHPPPLDLTPPTGGAALHWWTPQQSPQPGAIFTETSVESLPPWTFPTPPRSDSGVPSVSVDNNDEHPATTLSSDSGFLFEQPTSSAEMSSLGFLLPTHYGSGLYEEPNNYDMDASFIPPVRMSQSMGPPQGAVYASTAPSSNPALYQSKGSISSSPANDLPRLNETAHSQMEMPYRRATHLYESAPNHGYSMAGTPTIPSITDLTQSPMASPHIGSSYPPSAARSPNMYDATAFGQSYTSQPLVSHGVYATPGASPQLNYGGYAQPAAHEANGKPSSMSSNDASMRVLNERPKPRCWDHGCNGRQFSTFSNLLRHQREKSGSAQKSYCPKCGAVFTRTTARNGHVAHDKCTKQRRTSDGAKA